MSERDAPQAVPAEDVANLVAYLSNPPMGGNNHAAGPYGREQMKIAAAALTSLSAERDHYAASELAGVEKARELFKRLEASKAEATSMRTIISECAKALGSGAYIGPTCTVEFMGNLPEEIRLVVADLRRKLEEAERERDDAAKKREEEDSATSEFLDLINNQVEAVGKAKAAIIDALTARAEAAERNLEEHRKALELIAGLDPVEAALDPGWAARTATRTLSGASE